MVRGENKIRGTSGSRTMRSTRRVLRLLGLEGGGGGPRENAICGGRTGRGDLDAFMDQSPQNPQHLGAYTVRELYI